MEFTGLPELRAALLALPQQLTEEATSIITGRAERGAANIRARYPTKTGNLRRGVKVISQVDRFHVSIAVKNTAKHATIFELGTATRHTRKGWNRGVMPPGRVFVPEMIRQRYGMYTDLAALLARHGLTVVGR
jgi:hypothetical protein